MIHRTDFDDSRFIEFVGVFLLVMPFDEPMLCMPGGFNKNGERLIGSA